jgi:hypothetical protein
MAAKDSAIFELPINIPSIKAKNILRPPILIWYKANINSVIGHKWEKLAKWYEYAEINPGVNRPSKPKYEMENIVIILNLPNIFISSPRTHLKIIKLHKVTTATTNKVQRATSEVLTEFTLEVSKSA